MYVNIFIKYENIYNLRLIEIFQYLGIKSFFNWGYYCYDEYYDRLVCLFYLCVNLFLFLLNGKVINIKDLF